MKKWGPRAKVSMRSDGEPAIVDLLNKVPDLRDPETLPEQSPPTDSRADGLTERAIQSVQKQTRTFKLALERNVGRGIGVEHHCFQLLISTRR